MNWTLFRFRRTIQKTDSFLPLQSIPGGFSSQAEENYRFAERSKAHSKFFLCDNKCKLNWITEKTCYPDPLLCVLVKCLVCQLISLNLSGRHSRLKTSGFSKNYFTFERRLLKLSGDNVRGKKVINSRTHEGTWWFE